VNDSSGSQQRALVTRLPWDDHPAWSPDGQRIALATTADYDGRAQAQIHTVNMSGALVRLSHAASEERYPAWSPDGAWIVFDSGRAGNREIWKMRADGSQVTRLTHDEAYDEQGDWSPDGRQIAFIRKSGDRGDDPAYRNHLGDIWVMDSDGSGARTLVTCSCAVDPRWSPDGRWIVYARGSGDKTLGSTLWAVRVSDGRQVQLTSGRRDWRPDWRG
jgi:TolB protein